MWGWKESRFRRNDNAFKEPNCPYRKIWITLLAIFANLQCVILSVLLQELFRLIVRVNVDLGQCIVDSLLLIACSECGFQEWQENLEAVSRLNFLDKLIDWHRSWIDSCKEILDDRFITINVE